MIRAEDPLAAGQGPFVQRDRLGAPGRLPVGLAEIVPGVQPGWDSPFVLGRPSAVRICQLGSVLRCHGGRGR